MNKKLVSAEQLDKLNKLIDTQKSRLGLKNDGDLARKIGVSAKTISFWRHGRLGRSGVAMIHLLLPE